MSEFISTMLKGNTKLHHGDRFVIKGLYAGGYLHNYDFYEGSYKYQAVLTQDAEHPFEIMLNDSITDEVERKRILEGAQEMITKTSKRQDGSDALYIKRKTVFKNGLTPTTVDQMNAAQKAAGLPETFKAEIEEWSKPKVFNLTESGELEPTTDQPSFMPPTPVFVEVFIRNSDISKDKNAPITTPNQVQLNSVILTPETKRYVPTSKSPLAGYGFGSTTANVSSTAATPEAPAAQTEVASEVPKTEPDTTTLDFSENPF